MAPRSAAENLQDIEAFARTGNLSGMGVIASERLWLQTPQYRHFVSNLISHLGQGEWVERTDVKLQVPLCQIPACNGIIVFRRCHTP